MFEMLKQWTSLLFIVGAMMGCRDASPPPVVLPPAKRSLPTVTETLATPTEAEIEVDVDTALRRARSAASAQRFNDALALIKPLLIADPNQADVIFLQAQCEAGLGRLADAVETLDRIPLNRSEVSLAACGQSADCLIELKRYDKAVVKLRQLVDQVPNHPLAHRRLAQILNNTGRRIEAAPHMRKLAELGFASDEELFGMHAFTDPFIDRGGAGWQPIQLSDLAQARVLWFDSKYREALQATEQLFQQFPSDPSVAAFRGRVLADMQADDELELWQGQLPDEISSQPEYWYAVGTWHQRRDEHPVAIRCFLEAVARDDTDRLSYLGLARSLQLLGRESESQRVESRYELLEGLWFVVTSYARDAADYQQIVTRLTELQRFDEARGWASMAQASGFDMPTLPANTKLPANPLWAVCGLDLQQWPAPENIKAPLLAADGSGVANSESALTISQPQQTVNGKQINPIQFNDVAAAVGLDFRYQAAPDDQVEKLLLHQTMSSGVAVVDYDQDGWPDIYFTQSGGLPHQPHGSLPNRLFRNRSGERFMEVSLAAGVGDRGYGQGCTAGDLNQDGFPDLVVANHGPNVVLINQGDGTFRRADSEVTATASMWTTSVACADLDGDQLPDLIEVNYIDDPACYDALCSGETAVPLCSPQRFQPAADRFFWNDGQGDLVEKPAVKSSVVAGYGLGVVVGNFDQRAGNDVFIGNDTDANHYWQSQLAPAAADMDLDVTTNRHEPRFALVERAQLMGCAFGLQGLAVSCMGIATGDFDRNGRIDFHVTNYARESSDLFMQTQSGMFVNRFAAYQLDRATDAMLSWGTQAADLDHDGWLDLVILNGNIYNHAVDGTPYRMRPQLLRGGPRSFELSDADVSERSYWDRPTLGRSLAKTDFNRDGKTDFVATHLDVPVSLLRNDTAAGEWIGLELVGVRSERTAVGAEVRGHVGDRQITAFRTAGDGFFCSNDPAWVIGLGQVPRHQRLSIDVSWPSGQQQSLANLQPGGYCRLIGGQAAWSEAVSASAKNR